MIDWINTMADTTCYTKIESLCDGVGYCQIMNKIFPKCLAISRVKVNASQVWEKINNLKILQGAFTACKVSNDVPIESLTKQKFQDNYEFSLWFKKFAEANFSQHELSTAQDTPDRKVKDLNISSSSKKRPFTFKRVLSE